MTDGAAAEAMFAGLDGLVFDGLGNLYVTQMGAVRKITPDGIVSTIAGVSPDKLGLVKYDSIDLVNPHALTFDGDKNLYVTAHSGIYIRVIKIAPDNQVNVLVGHPFDSHIGTTPHKDEVFAPNGIVYNAVQKALYITDGIKGIIRATPDGASYCYAGCESIYDHIDGDISIAKFRQHSGAVIDKAGNIYMGDEHFIRKITPDGLVSTVAGTGQLGKQDGPGDRATFNYPSYLAFDSKGNLYVSDNNGIRKIVLGSK